MKLPCLRLVIIDKQNYVDFFLQNNTENTKKLNQKKCEELDFKKQNLSQMNFPSLNNYSSNVVFGSRISNS